MAQLVAPLVPIQLWVFPIQIVFGCKQIIMYSSNW